MKKTILLLSVLIAYSSLPAQTAKDTFMVVKVVQAFDNRNQQNMFYISPTGPTRHNDINALVRYDKKQFYHEKTDTDFYFLRSDTSKVFFNYFRSHEDVLEYLTARNWKLVNIISEVTSTYNVVYGQYSAGSTPVFYLKRDAAGR